MGRSRRSKLKFQRKRIFSFNYVAYSNARPQSVNFHLAGVAELILARAFVRQGRYAFARYTLQHSRRCRELAGKFLPI